MWRVIGILALIFIVFQFSRHQSEQKEIERASAQRQYIQERRDEAQEQAESEAIDDLEGTTYQDNLGSYGCTSDCSGHDAGFEWAQERELTDRYECSGNSQSFIEGCEAYFDELESKTEERLEVLEEEVEDSEY